MIVEDEGGQMRPMMRPEPCPPAPKAFQPLPALRSQPLREEVEGRHFVLASGLSVLSLVVVLLRCARGWLASTLLRRLCSKSKG